MRAQRFEFARLVVRFTLVPAICGAVLFCTAIFAEEMRVWTDATGKHSLKGSFVKVEDGKVYLKQESGKEMIIPLDKLSAADAKTAKDLNESNPFKESAETSPFTPAAPTAKNATVRVVPNWHDTKRLTDTIAPLDWTVEIKSPPAPAVGDKAEKAPRPVNITGVRKDLHSSLQTLTFSPASKRAMISFTNPFGEDGLTLAMLDLAAGKMLGSAKASKEFKLIAYAPDGDRILVGLDHEPVLEIWNLTKTGIVRSKSWVSQENKDDWNKEAKWGMFLDDKRVMVGGNWGKVVVWDVDKPSPLATINSESRSLGSGKLDTSRDGRYCLLRNNGRLVLLDLTTLEFLASKNIEGMSGAGMSPDNKSIAVLTTDQRIIVFDAATGKTQSEFRVLGLAGGGEVEYTSPTTLLIGDRTLVDLTKKMAIWRYDGINTSQQFGEYRWAHFTSGSLNNKVDALVPFKIPHEPAKAAAVNFTPPPIEYYLQPGDGVALDLTGLGDGQQIQLAEAAITKRLKELGYVVDPQSPIRLVGMIETGMPQTLRYRNFGIGGGGEETHTFTPRTSRLKYLLGDKVIYQTAGSSGWAPTGMVRLNQGETIAQKINAAEQPNYRVFTSPALPKEVEKEPENAVAGSSTFSIEGFKDRLNR